MIIFAINISQMTWIDIAWPITDLWQIWHNLYCEASWQLRTSEGHSYHLEAIKSGKTLPVFYEVKIVICFSSVVDFSPVKFHQPGIMNDVLQGNQISSLFQEIYLTSFPLCHQTFFLKASPISGNTVGKWYVFRSLYSIVGDALWSWSSILQADS